MNKMISSSFKLLQFQIITESRCPVFMSTKSGNPSTSVGPLVLKNISTVRKKTKTTTTVGQAAKYMINELQNVCSQSEPTENKK